MSCNGCAAEALGIATDAQFAIDYPNCTEGQMIYCLNGALTAAPRGCTRFFGEARNDMAIAITDIPAGDFNYDLAPNTMKTDLPFVNDTCYPMNIIGNMSHQGQIFWRQDDTDILAISATTTVDGVDVPSTVGAGGISNVRGNGFDPYDFYSNQYTVPLGVLAPGASMLVGLSVRTVVIYGTFPPIAPFSRIDLWSSAIRVTGSTVCP